MDDLFRLLIRRESARTPFRGMASGGSPAFVGRVTTASPAVGKFLLVNPVDVTGTETEGGPGTLTLVAPTSSIPVYLVGPGNATTGDYLICRFVDYRWVAEKGSGPSGSGYTYPPTDLPYCFCDPVPGCLTMTSADETCNYGMFQSCTIVYGPTPAWAQTLNLGASCYLSTQGFPDELSGGAIFYYNLTCQYNQFLLYRVYPTSPYGSPYRDGLLYSWGIGGPGNSCDPFALTQGVPYAGSDASCSVSITACGDVVFGDGDGNAIGDGDGNAVGES